MDDEPVEEVLAAWDAGEKAVTAPDLSALYVAVEADNGTSLSTMISQVLATFDEPTIKQVVLLLVHRLDANDRAEVVEAIAREAAAS